MYKTEDRDIWRVFRNHHYLSRDLSESSICYTCYLDNILVGFCALMYQPSGVYKYAYRVHRIVILPDYQNLGIGLKFLEFIADKYINDGYKFYLRTTHLRMVSYCRHHKTWEETSSSGKVSSKGCATSRIHYGIRDRELGRIAYSFEYMGKDYTTKKMLHLYIEDNDNINYKLLKEDLKHLKETNYVVVHTGEINTPSKIEKICLSCGIRTELLYHTVNRVVELKSNSNSNKIITCWDESLHEKIINNNSIDNLEERYFLPANSNVQDTIDYYKLKENVLW